MIINSGLSSIRAKVSFVNLVLKIFNVQYLFNIFLFFLQHPFFFNYLIQPFFNFIIIMRKLQENDPKLQIFYQCMMVFFLQLQKAVFTATYNIQLKVEIPHRLHYLLSNM